MPFAKATLALFLSLISNALFAQGSKYPLVDGYIITKEGDTVRGQLRLFNDYRSCRTAHFTYSDGRTAKLGPFEIQGYSRNGEYFDTRRVFFMKRMVLGEISLYILFSRDFTFINGGGVILAGYSKITTVHLFRKGAKNTKNIYPHNFRRVMSKWTRDNETLYKKIRAREYTYDNLVEVLTIYNNGRQLKK